MASGNDRAARRLLRALATLLVLLLVALAVGMPISFVLQRGGQFSNQLIGQRGTALQHRLRVLGPALAYAPSLDSTISPDSAGRAMHTTLTTLRPPRARSAVPVSERPAASFVPFPSLFAEDAPFRDLPPTGTPLPDPTPLFARAVRGLSPTERLWLQDVAEHSVWPIFAVVARASEVDILGGRFALPFPAGTEPFALPIMSVTTNNQLTIANGLRASLYLADGRRADAERALREAIGFGRALLTGPWMIDEVMGAATINRAVSLLIAYYDAVGDARADSLRAAPKFAASAVRADEGEERVRALADDRRARERRVVAEIRDPNLRTSERLERLSLLGLLQCTTLRGVFLGPTAEVTAVFAWARDSVARYESERELIRISAEVPASLAGEGRVSSRRLVPRAWMLDAWGRLTGSPRIQGCARVLAGYRA
jgi:hypothetical protein